MHIGSFRVQNFKSFNETPEVALTPGFNVIVGQNNVGKTALVEALSLAAGNKPHRSLKALPTPTTPVGPASLVSVSFEMDGTELADLLRSSANGCWVPSPEGRSADDSISSFAKAIRRSHQVLRCSFQAGSVTAATLDSFGDHRQTRRCVNVRVVDVKGTVELGAGGVANVNPGGSFDHWLAGVLRDRVYTFRAERLNVGVHRFGHNNVLRPDAANLPEVLDNLQGRNPERFSRLNRLVHEVFPAVQRVTVRPLPNDYLEAIVWTIDPSTEREDLAVPLSESGTGIGQVLAMLYVTLTASSPQFILIDEPQSFLHPGAVRKLIEILKEQSQHQFVITTHSPIALTASHPGTLLRLRLEDGETIVDRLDVDEAHDLRLILADVGARLSDVFGADAVLWAEGRTEELCFARIAEVHQVRLRGTAIVGVVQTGDFEGRHAATIVDIYRRLSSGKGLLPPAVGFIFDREGRTDRQREDLARYGNVHFLPRRMYENYLLNPAAIAAVARSIAGFREAPLTDGEVIAWLNRHRWDAEYFDAVPSTRDDEAWLREVRGARVLTDLFDALSDQRVQYDKVRHGMRLTEWLLENVPGQLADIARLLNKALGSVNMT